MTELAEHAPARTTRSMSHGAHQLAQIHTPSNPTPIATEVTEQMSDERTQPNQDSVNEYAAMESTAAHWETIRTKYPDWYAMYEDVMPDTVATRSEMIELWTTAPTDWAKGVIYGKFTLRLEIAAHTGIAFV